MRTSRTVLSLSLAALGCHFAVLALHSITASDATKSQLTLASNAIEFLLVALAAVACFEAGQRTSAYARNFWRLMASAFVLYAIGQAIASYYSSVLHASFEVYWPNEAFFLFH